MSRSRPGGPVQLIGRHTSDCSEVQTQPHRHTLPPSVRTLRDSVAIVAQRSMAGLAAIAHASWMAWPPTLYKARGVPLKQPICAICVDRTRGETARIGLGYGVSIWLCAAHGSAEFMCENGGRDFVLTLERLWQACGCLTGARRRALSAHLEGLRGRRRATRAPGSYAWPKLRLEAEASFLAGEPPDLMIGRLRERHAGDFACIPTVFTMRRWHRERRWLRLAPRASPA